MKPAFLALAIAAIASSALALEGASVICMPNGDVEIENVGSAGAALRTVVELNTNADYRVVCQVYYRDNLNPLPTEPEEIAQTDRLVNLMLATYLGGECWDWLPEELVESYRQGEVFALLDAFPEWMATAIAEIYDTEDLEKPDLTVVAVSMKAVGEFGQLVSE